MKSFLLDYDVKSGTLVSLREYEVRSDAQRDRLELELAHARAGIRREVVVLECESEAELRAYNRRYFETIHELLNGVEPAPPSKGDAPPTHS